MGWIDELATALGAEPLSDDEVERLLDVAREVAHGVERKVTPLATFLLGMKVGRRMEEGDPRAASVDAAIADLLATIPAAYRTVEPRICLGSGRRSPARGARRSTSRPCTRWRPRSGRRSPASCERPGRTLT